MCRFTSMHSRVVALIAAVLLLDASPAPLPTVPPGIGGALQSIIQKIAGDAVAPYGVDPNHARGTVTFFRRFDLQVRMPLDTYKQIHLHQGTIINPRGATLTPGQSVDVRGSQNSDGSMNADEITIVHG